MISTQQAVNSLLNIPSLSSTTSTVAPLSELSVLPIVARTADTLASTLIDLACAATAAAYDTQRFVAGYSVLYTVTQRDRAHSNMPELESDSFYFVYSGTTVSDAMPLSVCVQMLHQLTQSEFGGY